MTHNDLSWKFINDFAFENEHQTKARALSIEHGVTPIDASIGSQMAVIAAATQATNMIEIGTGFGLSGLWLLTGAPEATLTSIDAEFEYHEQARTIFAEAGHAASKVRLITGRALDVLPRMNESSYDVVLIDADPADILENVEHALRLVRTGGTILIPHALQNGSVANPADRSAIATAFRRVHTDTATDEGIVASLSPAGDGLLQLVKTF